MNTRRCLGKLPPRPRVNALHFADYLRVPAKAILATLPAAPVESDYDPPATSLRMWANDRIGDCAFAGQANAELVWATARGEQFTLTDDDVIAAYSACTGYSPAFPESDKGTVLADALDQWQRDGIGGRKILGSVSIDPRNLDHVRLACWLFGVVYVGAALPITAQTAGPWVGAAPGALAGDAAPGSWGGHCLTRAHQKLAIGGDMLTWERVQPHDDLWWLDYIDECHGPLSADWADVSRVAPNGFALAQLQADMGVLA